VPLYHRLYEAGHLQFITSSTYRRIPIFTDFAFAPFFVEALRAARAKFRFRLVGWVLMPEHFHLLFQPADARLTSAIVKDTKQRSAATILKLLRARRDVPAYRSLLRALRLPPSVHDEAHFRVWQRRFVPFGVFSEKKTREKLDYMHQNPVRRRLVASPADWPWSSWRFCNLGEKSILEMDRLD
jgi:putative transposase